MNEIHALRISTPFTVISLAHNLIDKPVTRLVFGVIIDYLTLLQILMSIILTAYCRTEYVNIDKVAVSLLVIYVMHLPSFG